MQLELASFQTTVIKDLPSMVHLSKRCYTYKSSPNFFKWLFQRGCRLYLDKKDSFEDATDCAVALATKNAEAWHYPLRNLKYKEDLN